MDGEFEIVREGSLQTTPEEYWDAITTGNGGWLWPMEFEPRVGGQAAFGGTVTEWEPPHRLATRVDAPNGWFNQLEHTVDDAGDGTVRFRYVHSGVFVDNWENQFNGADEHTDFYLHTLGQYLAHFSRRPVVYTSTDAPAASQNPAGFDTLRAALGLGSGTKQGDTVTVELPGEGPTEVTVDYWHPHFLGLRSGDTMYRFFGRNVFGAPVGFAAHLFAPNADADATRKSWQQWLDDVYA
ncbi:SRPBCC family protein [Catellatospora tritici]|uniref:SRPBCC family protein n=1 Tax=Catellatospora tritici TaxID=2851566 RepID=UPI001C2DA200|nr:hypothetical protein [Catellatospora tritici]MBV1856097.1 hypothetical protein [Catellatospora tritici]